MKFSQKLVDILAQKLFLFLLTASCAPLELSKRESLEVNDAIRLSTDEALLTDILGAENFEIYDAETVLIYKPDRVYQVHVPQEAALLQVVNEETIGEDLMSLSELLKELLPLPQTMDLEHFKSMTGNAESADLVFNDMDSNGDGILDEAEIESCIDSKPEGLQAFDN